MITRSRIAIAPVSPALKGNTVQLVVFKIPQPSFQRDLVPSFLRRAREDQPLTASVLH
jgi:hypothetical protein